MACSLVVANVEIFTEADASAWWDEADASTSGIFTEADASAW